MDIDRDVAGRALAGESLSAAELDDLASADLLSLGMLADEARRMRVGDTVTYVRVHEWSGNADVVGDAGEVRVSVLPATLAAAVATVASARAAAGARLVTAGSLADLVDRSWGELGEVLQALKAAGLDGIAEAPVDRIPDISAALQACHDSAVPVRCLTIQKPVGEARTPLLIELRSLVNRFPDLRTVAPLSREQSVAVPTTGYDDVRAVALARLALPTVPSIQVDWAQYGPKLAQVALTFGANHLDRVPAINDESLGRRRTAIEDVRRNIEAAGFTPVERDLPA